MDLVRTLLLVTLVAAAPGAMSQAPEAGRLLVSNPGLRDPNFSETVLLILLHEDNGTAAIFLNRPTWIDPQEAFPEIDTLADYEGALFRGGPVAPAELLLLFEHAGAPPPGVLPVLDGIYFSPNPELLGDIDSTSPDAPRVRLFAGRAEWGPGQLAREIAAGRWRVVGADADDLFAGDTSNLWQRIPLAGDGVTAFLN
jgi:putative transcriptional regulator